MEKIALINYFSTEDEKFVKDMNELSSEAQRKLLLKKTEEFCWSFYENKMDKVGIVKRNFHILINDDLQRDLRIQREEYTTWLRKKIIKWTLWNKQHRIEGTYGELIYQLIKLINLGG